MEQCIRKLPKVELHAHLNGCVREATLFELAKERGVQLNTHHFSHHHHHQANSENDHSMYNVRPRSLMDCFDMFAEISQCVDDLPALARIAREALEDFAKANVIYLELRSSLKRLKIKSGQPEMADKLAYCKTILDCMEDFEKNQKNASGKSMTCRFIVAVDRARSLEETEENIQLALKLREQFNHRIVGVDLCGNPMKVSRGHL